VRRLRGEEGGWALVTAVLLMTVMLGSALSLATYMDQLTRESGITRVRETSFNAAESALTSQVTSLTSQGWPRAAGDPWPACTPATPATESRCPSATAMRALHNSADTRTGLTWTTSVRDDTGGTSACQGSFYDDAAMRTAPAYDANGNGCLWIRAQGTVRARPRTLVALVRSQQSPPTLPSDFAVYGGRVDFDNNAVKEFVIGGKVSARCTPVMNEPVACAGYPLGTSKARDIASLQASFSASVGSRDASWGVDRPTMTEHERQAWRRRAIELGTYYTSCPASLTGSVVWIEGPVTCSYAGNLVFNSAERPGLLVLNGARALALDGFVQYYGVMYYPNPANLTSAVFDLQGNARVIGAVLADGPATLNIGTSGQGNITYAPSAYDATRLPGTAGVVQNTWRELPPGAVAP
jgi:Tfp pilus assembly protein PilX